MCNHLNLKILIHIFSNYLSHYIIMRGENFVAHLDGLGGTPVCRRTPVAHRCCREWINVKKITSKQDEKE
jgi:hypothetical protein